MHPDRFLCACFLLLGRRSASPVGVFVHIHWIVLCVRVRARMCLLQRDCVSVSMHIAHFQMAILFCVYVAFLHTLNFGHSPCIRPLLCGFWHVRTYKFIHNCNIKKNTSYILTYAHHHSLPLHYPHTFPGPAPQDSHDGPPPLPPLFLSLANVSGDHGTIGTPVSPFALLNPVQSEQLS